MDGLNGRLLGKSPNVDMTKPQAQADARAYYERISDIQRMAAEMTYPEVDQVTRIGADAIVFMDGSQVTAVFDADGVAMAQISEGFSLNYTIGAITEDDVLTAMRAFKRGRHSGRKFSERMRAALNAFVGNHLAR